MAKTILIVEDNDLNMKLFIDLLQAHGYNTLQTMCGRDVMSLAHEHKPDLILMDIQLPDVNQWLPIFSKNTVPRVFFPFPKSCMKLCKECISQRENGGS